MKTIIIGRGAVGASVAFTLKDSDVSFAVDESRVFRSQSYIVYNGEKIKIPTLSTSLNKEKADLIIVAVKNFDLYSALPVKKAFLKDNTVVLPLLNGIEAEDIIGEEIGKERVMYGFYQGLSAYREGTVITSFSLGKITFGEKDGEKSERGEKIKEYFEKYGQECFFSSTILHDKWVKFMTNVCFNTITAVLSLPYSTLRDNPDAIRAARLMAKEVQSVALKEGIIITQDDTERMILSTLSLTGGKSSMLEDIENGRETENRYFTGKISRLGKKYSIPTPYADLMNILLEAKRH